jgi:hypothetical protein
MTWKPRRIAAKIGVSAAAAVTALCLFTNSAFAGAFAGAATVTAPDTVTKLTQGGSQTQWTLVLPQGASCSKDTATGNYHVFSFVVPKSVDPSTLTFSSTGPSQGFPLVDQFGNPYIAANTAIGTGAVPQSPTFTWNAFSIDGRNATAVLAAGTYFVGIACATQAGVEDKFWSQAETFSASASDPNGETWAVDPSQNIPESPWAIALPVSAVVLLGTGFVVIRRRRSRQAASVA